MTIKTIIFLDDEREINDVTWVKYPLDHIVVHTVRTYLDFLNAVNTFIVENDVHLSEILFSFDHDIQDFKCGAERTGKHCAEYLCDIILVKGIDPLDLKYVVHSMNPVGKKNIICYIEQFKEHFGVKN